MSRETAKPNLIYIFADQLRYFSLGYAGDKRAQTPNIDAFQAECTDLCQTVSGHPVCAPYRASLFTGKYTTSTGMVINEIRMNPNHHTFADVLNENGYETAYIGKWHMYAAELGNHYDPKNSYIPRGRDRLGFNGYFAGYNFRHEYSVGTAYYHLDSPEKIYYDKYEPDAQVDMAVKQLERLKEGTSPFALFLSIGTPHDPWIPENVPEEYLKKFADTQFEYPPNYLPDNDPHADEWARLREEERKELTEWMRVYYAMVANLDDNMGRLFREIRRLGLEENSIVVFTSDHGEMFGAHGRRAKNIFYEEAIRVPMLMRWPGHLEKNAKRDCVVNTVDIMPTLLSLMGLPVPAGVEGTDLSRTVKDCESGVRNESAIRKEPHTRENPEKPWENGALLMCTGPTAAWGDGQEWRAYRTRRYKYARYKSDGQEFLFDLEADPYEKNNLIGIPEFRETEENMKKQMEEKMAAIGDHFENNTYYKEHWVEDRIIRRTATIEGDT